MVVTLHSSTTIHAVVGFPRCGSSLVMSMLHAGGFPCVFEDDTSFEHPQAAESPLDEAWLESCVGKAVKLLDPLDTKPTRRFAYRFIALDRNHRWQSQSQLKLLSCLAGIRLARGTLRDIIRSLDRDWPHMVRTLQDYPRGELHIFDFADVLARPRETAHRLAELTDPSLDVDRMAACVRPRSPQCYDGFLELDLMPAD